MDFVNRGGGALPEGLRKDLRRDCPCRRSVLQKGAGGPRARDREYEARTSVPRDRAFVSFRSSSSQHSRPYGRSARLDNRARIPPSELSLACEPARELRCRPLTSGRRSQRRSQGKARGGGSARRAGPRRRAPVPLVRLRRGLIAPRSLPGLGPCCRWPPLHLKEPDQALRSGRGLTSAEGKSRNSVNLLCEH
jgi:hypothetical protein